MNPNPKPKHGLRCNTIRVLSQLSKLKRASGTITSIPNPPRARAQHPLPVTTEKEVRPLLFSIVIPLRRLDERRLSACLASIEAQSYPTREIIIVDSSFDLRAKDIADAHKATIIMTRASKPQARNIGVAMSNGDLVLHLDQDMVLTAGVLSECVSRFEEGSRAVVIPEEVDGSGFFMNCRRLEKKSYVGNPSLEAARAVTKPLHEKIGGFDELFGEIDEYSYHAKIERGRFEIGRISSPIFCHPSIVSLRSRLKFGRYAGIYEESYPDEARLQFSPLKRTRLYSSILRSDPVHFLGIILLKILDFSAFSVGSFLGPPPNGGHAKASSERQRDKLVPQWDAIILEETAGRRYLEERERATVRHMMRLCAGPIDLTNHGLVALDIGGGKGRLSDIPLCYGFFTINIDISAIRCKESQKAHRSASFEAVCADYRFLPIQTRKVSFALCFRSAKYLRDISPALREAERILVERGGLVLELPNALFFPYFVGKRVVATIIDTSKHPTFDYMKNIRLYTPEQSKNFITDSGLSVLSVESLFLLPEAILCRLKSPTIVSFISVLEERLMPRYFWRLISRSLVILTRKQARQENPLFYGTGRK